MQKFEFGDSWKEMRNWWFKSLGENLRMMNEAQEQIKKLKSCEIRMERWLWVNANEEKLQSMWIDEMEMELVL